MTPVEKLTAAIEKLERLKAGSDPIRHDSTWVIDYDVAEDARRILILDSHNGGWDGSTVAEVASEGRAQLIVTLHRTVDAQLAILRYAADSGFVTFGGGVSYDSNAVALADAILGTPNEEAVSA